MIKSSGVIPNVSSMDHAVDASRDVTKATTVTASASGVVTVACPVGLSYDNNGVLKATKIAIDANTRQNRWGVAKATVADGEAVEIVIQGLAVCASGGTAGQVGSVISNAGAITDGALGATTADVSHFVSLSATDIYIF